MNEQSLWRWLAKRLPPGDYTRIESPSSPGVPDVNYLFLKTTSSPGWPTVHDWPVHGWMELKIGGPGNYPMRGERRGLRASQKVWIKQRIALGGIVPIVAAMGLALAVWRLKSTQVDRFNDLDRDTLHEIADFWQPRRTIKLIPIDLLS